MSRETFVNRVADPQLLVDFFYEINDEHARDAALYAKKQIKTIIKAGLEKAYAFEVNATGGQMTEMYSRVVGSTTKEAIQAKYREMNKMFQIQLTTKFRPAADLTFVFSTVTQANLQEKKRVARSLVQLNGRPQNRVWVLSKNYSPAQERKHEQQIFSRLADMLKRQEVHYDPIDHSFASGTMLQDNNGVHVHFSLYVKKDDRSTAKTKRDLLSRFCRECIPKNQFNVVGMINIMAAVYVTKKKLEDTLRSRPKGKRHRRQNKSGTAAVVETEDEPAQESEWYRDPKVQVAFAAVVVLGFVAGCQFVSGGTGQVVCQGASDLMQHMFNNYVVPLVDVTKVGAMSGAGIGAAKTLLLDRHDTYQDKATSVLKNAYSGAIDGSIAAMSVNAIETVAAPALSGISSHLAMDSVANTAAAGLISGTVVDKNHNVTKGVESAATNTGIGLGLKIWKQVSPGLRAWFGV